MDHEKKTYTIAGRQFYQQEPVWGQLRWLDKIAADARKAGHVLEGATPEQFAEFIGAYGTQIMAAVLIPAEWTTEQKVKAGLVGLKELEVWLDAHLREEDVAPIMQDFFVYRLRRLPILQVAPRDAYEPAQAPEAVAAG